MSTRPTPERHDDEELSEDLVAEYLRTHPEFFEAQTGLLSVLKVPHPCGTAVSLIERQVSVLRDQNRRMRRKLMELVQVARENDRLAERLQRLTLRLLEAGSLEEVLITVDDVLRAEFAADAVVLQLFHEAGELASGASFVPPGDAGLRVFGGLLKSGRPLVGPLRPAQVNYLFGDQADEIGSAVVLVLREQREYGLLGIGSRDVARFHPAMGTAFILRMGELVSRTLRPHLGP
jgi:uncharacterized protein